MTYQLLDDLEADNEDSAETAYEYLETLLYDTEKESEEVAA